KRLAWRSSSTDFLERIFQVASTGTRSYNASERSSASVPLRPLPRAPPVEQAPAELISGLDVDLVPPQVVSPAFLSFPSFLSFLFQEQNMPDLFVARQEQCRSTNGPSRCFPAHSYGKRPG